LKTALIATSTAKTTKVAAAAATTTTTTTTETGTLTATSRPKHNQYVFLLSKVPAKDIVESKDKGSKPDTAEHNEVEALRSSTQVMGKEVKQVELRLHSAEQKLRDLNINIR